MLRQLFQAEHMGAQAKYRPSPFTQILSHMWTYPQIQTLKL